MTHYGSQQQNKTSHLGNAFKKCKKRRTNKDKDSSSTRKKDFPLFPLYQTYGQIQFIPDHKNITPILSFCLPCYFAGNCKLNFSKH